MQVMKEYRMHERLTSEISCSNLSLLRCSFILGICGFRGGSVSVNCWPRSDKREAICSGGESANTNLHLPYNISSIKLGRNLLSKSSQSSLFVCWQNRLSLLNLPDHQEDWRIWPNQNRKTVLRENQFFCREKILQVWKGRGLLLSSEVWNDWPVRG